MWQNTFFNKNIDDDGNFLYHHKPSSGCSESNVLKSLAISTADKEKTTENHCCSVLSTNNSTPSRHQQMLDMKSRISDLENENDFLYHEAEEKDAKIESLEDEILQLKSKNPDNLVESK
uniref:Uncharacterized protein n=1 Tax=Daphnia galeata TaxID=27404 RepID=A0A8J2W2T9_9CRUS|nr:unnamed protein product [Daphnia galeata]